LQIEAVQYVEILNVILHLFCCCFFLYDDLNFWDDIENDLNHCLVVLNILFNSIESNWHHSHLNLDRLWSVIIDNVLKINTEKNKSHNCLSCWMINVLFQFDELSKLNNVECWQHAVFKSFLWQFNSFEFFLSLLWWWIVDSDICCLMLIKSQWILLMMTRSIE